MKGRWTMCGYCVKKGRKIDDRKVIDWCLKQNFKQGCKNLRLQTERRRDGKANLRQMQGLPTRS